MNENTQAEKEPLKTNAEKVTEASKKFLEEMHKNTQGMSGSLRKVIESRAANEEAKRVADALKPQDPTKPKVGTIL